MAHKGKSTTFLESTVHNDSASACPDCDRPDWADDMVQCGECEDWYHFSCVGVSRSVEHRPWTCAECLPISVSSRSSRMSSTKALEMQRLQEEQEIRRKRFLQEKALEKKRLEQERQQILAEEELERTFLKEKFELLEMQEVDEKGSTVSSRRSNRESILQWMRNDGTVEPRCRTLNAAIGQPPNPEAPEQRKITVGGRNVVSTYPAVNPPMLNSQPVASSSQISHQERNETVEMNTMNHRSPVPKPRAPAPQPRPRIRKSTHHVPPAPPASAVTDNATLDIPPLPFEYCSSEVDMYLPPQRKSAARIRRANPALQSTQLPTFLDEVRPDTTFQPSSRNVRHTGSQFIPDMHVRDESTADQGPTAAQIAARRVMSRDLPDFCGNPEDWPIFISQYEITTNSCGFSNTENLIRLQRCLKGHARESVRSRLLLPASVPQVIETLRMLYGRPGLIISALLNRVRAAPAPRLERLETVIEFGMELQGLCDHLQASGETAHMNNPSLLQELEDKLPSQMKLQWAMHKQIVQCVTLQTFASYMSSMVTAHSVAFCRFRALF
ncbi:uncharacterized protein LOC134217056 [Armigeres subalbatus]|uniref:uncharacterized protein LOC134217056 n=1 Tax=Armigeres subalbatus TaxID=124917 RepID=UPI002ED4EDF9